MVDRRRALRSAWWSGIESGSLAVLSLVSLIVYTHLLMPETIGIFAVILAISEILTLFITMPFHDALVQKQEASDVDFDTAFSVTMAMSIAMAALAVLAAPFAASAFGYPETAPAFMTMALIFPLSGISATIIARQRRELAFRTLAIRSLVGRVSGAFLGIGMALAGFGLWSLIAQQLAMAGVASAMLWLLCRDRPRLRFAFDRFVPLIRFGAVSLGAALFNFSIKRVFIILVGLFLGARVTGYLNVAFRVYDTLWSLLATAVTQVALPVLSRLQGDEDRLRRTYLLVTALACLALYPCFIGLSAVAPELIALVFGAKWAPAAPLLSILACVAIVQVPRLFTGTMLVARGRPKDMLPGMIAQALFLAVMVTGFGIPGAMWAGGLWIACEVILTPIIFYMLWRQTGLGLRDQVRSIAGPLAAVAVMALAVAATRQGLPVDLPLSARFALLVTAGMASYALAIMIIDRKLIQEVATMFTHAFRRMPT